MTNSAEELIDQLGGAGTVASLAGVSTSAVCNWRSRKRIPLQYFLRLRSAAESKGISVDESMFGFKALAE